MTEKTARTGLTAGVRLMEIFNKGELTLQLFCLSLIKNLNKVKTQDCFQECMENNCHFKTWKSVTNGASRKLDNSFAEGLGFVVNEENRIYNVSANTTDEKDDFLTYMTLDYMSSEHSESESEAGDESGSSDNETSRSRVKVFSVGTLPWRSAELGELMQRLDRKFKRKQSAKSMDMTLQRKNRGIIPRRPAPEDAPPFALTQ
ncbi:hypothetical protein ACROYT_G014603 [Oculina patagonica]